MIYGAKELKASFDTVRRNTITIAEEIPADHYDFRAADGAMSVGEMLAHVAVAPMWQIAAHSNHVAHLDFAAFAEGRAQMQAAEKALATREQIIAALRGNGDRFSAFLGGLSDGILAEVVTFPPPVQPSSKTRFEMLLGVKEHEMHHRAQLMLIERMIGIVPHLTRQREAFRAQAAGGAR